MLLEKKKTWPIGLTKKLQIFIIKNFVYVSLGSINIINNPPTEKYMATDFHR